MSGMNTGSAAGGPTGVRLVWRESGDEIDVQDSVTYVGIQDDVHTFVVPVCAVWFAALEEGQLGLRMDVLPPRTQVGLVPEGEGEG